LFGSSSNTNAELILTLSDIAPDGSAVRFTSGAILGSLSDLDESKSWRDRNGTYIRPYLLLRRDRYFQRHAIHRLVFELMPSVQAILPGHSLRLTVTTSLGSCKPGIGQNPCYFTRVQKKTVPGGVYALERSSSYPSAVNLPLLPYNYLPAGRSAATPTSHGFREPLDWGE
jgi:predicted acyl esterase